MWPYAKAQPFFKLLIFSSMNMKVECIDDLCNEHQATLNRDLNGVLAPNPHSDCNVGIKCLSSHQRQTLIIGDQHFFICKSLHDQLLTVQYGLKAPDEHFLRSQKWQTKAFFSPLGSRIFFFFVFTIRILCFFVCVGFWRFCERL